MLPLTDLFSGWHIAEVTSKRPDYEKIIVSGAVRTDLVLSAEIMVIALSKVAHQGVWSQMVSLVVVAWCCCW